jgi:hypothetical protein
MLKTRRESVRVRTLQGCVKGWGLCDGEVLRLRGELVACWKEIGELETTICDGSSVHSGQGMCVNPAAVLLGDGFGVFELRG